MNANDTIETYGGTESYHRYMLGAGNHRWRKGAGRQVPVLLVPGYNSLLPIRVSGRRIPGMEIEGRRRKRICYR
jgi:hypothetical protein